ncbi:MAG: hypothetical protein HYW51_01560 [Candidatus Doudnabacteria bacterium]|nr:hypothetical protein [Candidatus Doudnabacteria bacterium]
MDQIFDIYQQFLNFFPDNLHGFVSLGLAILIVLAIYKILKRNFIFIILLIVLLPASIPILSNLWESLVNLLKFLLTKS